MVGNPKKLVTVMLRREVIDDLAATRGEGIGERSKSVGDFRGNESHRRADRLQPRIERGIASINTRGGETVIKI